MTPQDLILMEKIADKELKFWCLLEVFGDHVYEWIQSYAWKYWESIMYNSQFDKYSFWHCTDEQDLSIEILWTPPWLARCRWWIKNQDLEYEAWVRSLKKSFLRKLMHLRDDNHESLLDQKQEVKDFIIWLDEYIKEDKQKTKKTLDFK